MWTREYVRTREVGRQGQTSSLTTVLFFETPSLIESGARPCRPASLRDIVVSASSALGLQFSAASGFLKHVYQGWVCMHAWQAIY